MGTGAAIAASSVASGIGNAIGGRKAAGAIKENYGEAIKELQGVRDEQKELYSPWLEVGNRALQGLENFGDFDFTNIETFMDPGYEFRLQEGIDALDQSASSRGNLMSGGQQQAVTDYASNLASQEYGNAFQRALAQYSTNLGRQQHLAGLGQNALSGYSNALSNYGANVSGMYGSQGTQLANNAQTTAGGITSSINSGIGNYLLSGMIK